MVSPGLIEAVRGNGAKIYDGPDVQAASDHRPVVAVLELGPRKTAGGTGDAAQADRR
jgi:hypothetical protein